MPPLLFPGTCIAEAPRAEAGGKQKFQLLGVRLGWLPEEERGVSRPGTAPLADKFTVPEEAEAKEERERERELCDEKTTSKKIGSAV